MNKEREHSCCQCYYYHDVGNNAICKRTGNSTLDSRPKSSLCCKHWEQFIRGPIGWRDIKKLVEIADNLMPYASIKNGGLEHDFQTEENYYNEVLKRYNENNKQNHIP